MILGINSLNNNFFAGRKMIARAVRYSAAAAAMLLMASCTQKSNNKDEFIPSEAIETDSSYIKTENYKQEKDNSVRVEYHYSYKDKEISSTDYDWTEKIYPDGSIEIDSLEYKINIAPNGDRTEIKKEQDENGNIIISTLYPDSTKSVYTEYKMPQNAKFYTEFIYRKDGTLKEDKYYNEELSDTSDINSSKIITINNVRYDNNGNVLSWESNVPDSTHSEKYNKYDKLGRLIYDDIKEEQYTYKGSSNTPSRSVSVYEGCSRVTLYNDDGSIKRIYFESADGVITEPEETDSI